VLVNCKTGGTSVASGLQYAFVLEILLGMHRLSVVLGVFFMGIAAPKRSACMNSTSLLRNSIDTVFASQLR
jgi:hypothetical protein